MGQIAPAPRFNLPPSRDRGPTMKLCQAVVPEALLDAARAEWKERGLCTRQVMTWALMEYLAAVNPKKAQKLARKINVHA